MRVIATSFIILVSVLVSLPHYGSSFSPTNNDAAAMMSAITRRASTSTPPPTSTLLRAAVELKPEPEGGTELLKMSLSSLPGSRMKNLGPDDNGDGDVDVYKFWLTAIADGAQIKKVRDQTEKEASKKANFPGFRKGQVPPWAQPQITGFAIQEAIIKTCEMSLEAYGLESLPGSAGEVTVNEDIKELCKGYKMGSSVAFTATYRGKFDKSLRSSEAMATGVVDVEAVVAEDETETSIDVEVNAE